MIFVQISDGLDIPVDVPVLENAALQACRHQAVAPDADLTIVLSDDAQLHALNSEFLGIDAPTDVLSFPSGDVDPETGRLYLGDILISAERARSQAVAAGNALNDELQLLVVHGVLHLVGHDHAQADEKARMWQAQAEILAGLGCVLQGREE